MVGKNPLRLGRSAPRLYPPPRFGSRVEQDQGATRSNSGQDHSLPELPASVRPPDHARPQTGQATGQTRSADLRTGRYPRRLRLRQALRFWSEASSITCCMTELRALLK